MIAEKAKGRSDGRGSPDGARHNLRRQPSSGGRRLGGDRRRKRQPLPREDKGVGRADGEEASGALGEVRDCGGRNFAKSK
jgi:hypothetical protein